MKDQIKLVKITAVASNGDKFEYRDYLMWTATEEAPRPDATLEVEDVIERIAELDLEIEEKELELDSLEKGSDAHTATTLEINELKQDREDACTFTTCIDDSIKSGGTDTPDSALDLTVILVVIGVVIIALLVGLLFMRGGNNEGEGDMMVDWANSLPSNDAVANSMYGGAQEIFQQPVAATAATLESAPSSAPPLPVGGLPEGWTMEQWAHYGHQYEQ